MNKKVVKFNGRTLGFFIVDGRRIIFIAPRKSSHFFRLYGGWGINKAFLQNILDYVAEIRVVVDKGKKILVTTPQNWLLKGITYHKEGFEEQIILRERDFHKIYE